MDQTRLREKEAMCIQEEAPWCVARCPVHVDAKAMLLFAASGDYSSVFAQLRKKVPFPGIIARICDQPCGAECKRAKVGGAIRIRDIEKAGADFTENIAPPFPQRLPATGKNVAVIGAGLSGMTAAYDLAKKGHAVVVFEAAEEIGGRLRALPENLLPRAVASEELSIVERLGVEIRLGTRPDASVQDDFDAIYLGTGTGFPPPIPGLKIDGKLWIDPITFFTGAKKTFAGGSLTQEKLSFIGSISDGRRAAISIDRFLQNVSLDAGRDKEGSYETRLYTSLDGIPDVPPTIPSLGDAGYTKEEASVEGSRCLRCECMECVKVCEYLRRYGSYPKRYVREVYNNLSIVMGMRKANEFIDSCSLCGLCGVVCPNDLSMAEINLEARRVMADQGKSPPSAFDFALRDLAFSTGSEFFLSRGEKGRERSAYLFFPGCQLSASLPKHVEKAYEDLRAGLKEGVGLMLGCCGVPAEWAGQVTLASSVAETIAAEWKRLGEPTIIAGCPTCRKTLAARIPDAKVEHLIETLEKIGVANTTGMKVKKTVSIHDACTARADTKLQESVRHVVGNRGYQIAELKTSKATTECCGYGGLMYNSNRTLADAVTVRRAEQAGSDYVAYCAMCRDRFIAQGKTTSHVLELIYGTEKASPGFSQRRENRRRLKARLLREVWGEKTDEKERDMKISIADEVRESMEARFILMEDIEDVVRHAERTGEKLRDGSTGLFIANHRPGNVTYWVWYEKSDDGFLVRKVYSHRMNIMGTKS